MYIGALGAEGHANADLSGPPGDVEGHDAIEPDAGEERGDGAEGSAEDGYEAFHGEGNVDLFAHGAEVFNGQGGIFVLHDGADGRDEGFERSGGAEIESSAFDGTSLSGWHIDLTVGLIVAHVDLLDFTNNADDGHRKFVVAAKADSAADGVTVFKVYFGEGLADDGYLRSGGGIGLGKIAALEQGDAESVDEAGADFVDERIHVFFGAGLVAFDEDCGLAAAVSEEGLGGHGDFVDGGKGLQAPGDFAEQGRGRFLLVAVHGGADGEGEEMIGVEAGIVRTEVVEGGEEQGSGGEEEEGEGDLDDDEGFAEPGRRCGDGTGFVFQGGSNVRAGGGEGGGEAEE